MQLRCGQRCHILRIPQARSAGKTIGIAGIDYDRLRRRSPRKMLLTDAYRSSCHGIRGKYAFCFGRKAGIEKRQIFFAGLLEAAGCCRCRKPLRKDRRMIDLHQYLLLRLHQTHGFGVAHHDVRVLHGLAGSAFDQVINGGNNYDALAKCSNTDIAEIRSHHIF